VIAAAAVGPAIAFAPAAQAATFEVNSKLDNGDGTCDATCTIRDAVLTANLDAASDTITFRPGLSGTIVLTAGSLPVDSAMSIEGPGLDQVRISGDANRNNTPNVGDSRVFRIETDVVGAAYEPVSISGLTMTEGYDPDYGAALYSRYTDLTLDRVAALDSFNAEEGGGAFIRGGDLTVTDSVFADNYAEEQGGGFYVDGGANTQPQTVLIRNVTSSGNIGEDGGGLYLDADVDGALIADSTFSDNFSDDSGGGINIDGTDVSRPVIQNTTVSGNTAEDQGGGIYLDDGGDLGTRIENSTIAANVAGADGLGNGGGLYRFEGLGPTVLSSTIVADNADAAGPNDLGDSPLLPPALQADFSLIESPGTVVLSVDPAGSTLTGVDPELGPLAANGGPTRTHLPALTSPAIDAGTANGLQTDQRGLPRTAEQEKANAPGSDGTDIGSVEAEDTAVLGADASAKKKQKVKGKKVKVVVKAGADEVVDLLASGTVKAGKKSYKLKDKKAGDVAAGKTKKLTLKPKGKKAKQKIADVIADGKKAKATVDVTFTDGAGNTDTDRVKVTLLRKKK
jgi:predicted outer membrane repeat protein